MTTNTTSTTTYYHAGHIHLQHIPCGSVAIGAKVTQITGPATEAEMVALHGSECCSHCFPTAAAITRAATTSAPIQCPGTGTMGWDDVKGSSRAYRSPKGQCRHCGQLVRLSKPGRMHRH